MSALGVLPTEAAAPRPRWAAGSRVQLRGLTNAPQLNSQQGVVMGWLAGKGRYEVRLDGDGGGGRKRLNLKPGNLRDAPGGDRVGLWVSKHR